MSTIKTTTLSTQGGSTVPVDTVVNGTAKAWVNFNGTGTVAIRRAFNVSSVSDLGTGDFIVNFTTAMPDANYCINVNARGNGDFNRGGGGLVYVPNATLPTTSAVRFSTGLGSTAASDGLIFDQDYIFVTIFS